MFEFLKKKEGKDGPKPLMVALLSVLILLVLTQMYQIYKFRHRVQFIDSLEENNSQVIEELGIAQEYLTEFGTDLNQIRTFLLLPTKEYDFAGNKEEVALEEEDLNTLVFDFVSELGSYEQNKERFDSNRASLENWLPGVDWTASGLVLMDPLGVELEEGVEYSFRDLETEVTALTFTLSYDGEFGARSYDGSFAEEGMESFEDFQSVWTAFESDGLQGMLGNIGSVEGELALITEAMNLSTDFENLLLERGVRRTFLAEEAPDYFYFTFQNADLDVLAELRVSKEGGSLFWVSFGEETREDLLEQAVAIEVMMTRLSEMDVRTMGEKRFDENLEILEGIFEDPAFIAVLNGISLSIGESYESTGYVYFPILNMEGEELRAFELNRSTGELRVKEQDSEAQTLSAAIDGFRTDSKKKTLYSPTLFLSTLV